VRFLSSHRKGGNVCVMSLLNIKSEVTEFFVQWISGHEQCDEVFDFVQ